MMTKHGSDPHSDEGLLSDPLLSSAPKLLHEQKENPPWAEQGPATYSNCSSIPSGSSTGLVQRSAFYKVADVVSSNPWLPLESIEVLAQVAVPG